MILDMVSSLLIMIISILIIIIMEMIIRKLNQVVIINRTVKTELSSIYDNIINQREYIYEELKNIRNDINDINKRILEVESKLMDISERGIKKAPQITATHRATVIKRGEEDVIKRERIILTNTQKEIINILKEGPKTYREIQKRTGMSREHISRELKKLFEMGYLERNEREKPFIYKIKEETLLN